MQALVRDSGHWVVHAGEPEHLDAVQARFARADTWVLCLSEGADAGSTLSLLWEVEETSLLIDEARGAAAGEPAFGYWRRSLCDKLYASLGVVRRGAAEVLDNPLLAAAVQASQRRRAARYVWVLGASLGGPEAVRQFLAGIPPGLPVSLVYVQHIDASCSALLGRVMARSAALPVVELGDGSVLCPGQLGIVPVVQALEFLPLGRVRTGSGPWPGCYAPAIDAVIAGIAPLYGDRAGAIIFSGMGDDGARGCATLQRHGGAVWTQSSDSCVCAAMPESVSSLGGTNFAATPAGLAQALVERYRWQSEEDR